MIENKKEYKNAVLIKICEGERAVFVGEGASWIMFDGDAAVYDCLPTY